MDVSRKTSSSFITSIKYLYGASYPFGFHMISSHYFGSLLFLLTLETSLLLRSIYMRTQSNGKQASQSWVDRSSLNEAARRRRRRHRRSLALPLKSRDSISWPGRFLLSPLFSSLLFSFSPLYFLIHSQVDSL